MAVYFIYEDPFASGLDVDPDIESVIRQNHIIFVKEFKVGESNDPPDRIRNLQTGNPRQLFIYKVIDCATKQRAKALEEIIHQRLSHRRNRGEWFKVTKEEIDEICNEIYILFNLEWEKAKL